jgi:hypothetical protein
MPGSKQALPSAAAGTLTRISAGQINSSLGDTHGTADGAKPHTIIARTRDDLLRGADEIAAFIFGKTRSNRRKIYYLAETSRLPVFRLGAVLCARKSVLLGWISGQESRVRPNGT